jgi:UDP-N-acetylglucosamine 2-epimerase (hydrolysing)
MEYHTQNNQKPEKKRILFLTGTRADFGKIKSLLNVLEADSKFAVYIFVTGMHMHRLYGETYAEIEKCGYKNIYKYINHTSEATMDLTLSKTIEGLSSYIKEFPPDMIVVHGDRVETLAGAIVGSLNNIIVAHIEGGEISGTIDDLIRHAVTKMSHIHFVSNDESRQRLIQLGESVDAIFNIGSPDMDIMFSSDLPSLSETKQRYEINFDKYSIVLYHPVTTEYEMMDINAKNFVDALLQDRHNYVVIYPNNDLGSGYIMNEYRRLKHNERFRILPSMRFENFLTLLKHSDFIIGNSSSGIREAPVYGIPSVNIGSRQNNRAFASSIINAKEDKSSILGSIDITESINPKKEILFGKGASNIKFHEILCQEQIWKTSKQKQFNDLMLNHKERTNA